MKFILRIFFVIFLLALLIGFYLKHQQHPKADLVIGLDVLFLAFVLMPLFIYYRYRDGKYEKFIMKQNIPKKED